MLRFKSAVSAALLSSLACTAIDAAQWELSTGLSENNGSDATIYEIGGTYYFQELNHSSAQPWSETAYAKRIATLGFQAMQSESSTNDTFPDDTTVRSKTENTQFSLEGVHRSAASPHVFSASISYGELAIDFSVRSPLDGFTFDVDQEIDFYQYEVGYSYYLEENWTIGTRLGHLAGDEFNATILTLLTRNLIDLGLDQWLDVYLELSFADVSADSDESSEALSGGIDFYFTPQTSIGAETTFSEATDYNVTLSARHFFSNDTFIGASLQFIDPDEGSSNEVFGLEAGIRF